MPSCCIELAASQLVDTTHSEKTKRYLGALLVAGSTSLSGRLASLTCRHMRQPGTTYFMHIYVYTAVPDWYTDAYVLQTSKYAMPNAGQVLGASFWYAPTMTELSQNFSVFRNLPVD